MAVLVDGELVLYGFVGDSYWGDGFTAREVIDALAEIGRDNDVTVRINSGGGYVDDGVAIFNSLTAHKGKVTVVVDAIAASSASVIAMAGDERIMRKGAMMMIHDPSSVAWGTAADMERAVKMLEKHAENLAGIYAEVTGEDVGDIRDDMKDELWLTAEEAVERGFATSANDNKAKAAAAHDYSVYAHAPERLVALSGRKNWSHAEARHPSPPKAMASATAANRQTKEKSMKTDNSPADANAADNAKALADAAAKAQADTKARIKAITTCEEAAGREALASHLAYETDMDAEAAVAALKAAPQASADSGSGRDYETRRLAASALAQPGGEKTAAPSVAAKLNPTAIFNARRQATKGA